MIRNRGRPSRSDERSAKPASIFLHCSPILRLRLRSPTSRLSRGERVRRRARIVFGSVCLLRDTFLTPGCNLLPILMHLLLHTPLINPTYFIHGLGWDWRQLCRGGVFFRLGGGLRAGNG